MPSLLGRALTLLRAPRNSVLFAVRRTLRWSRGPVALANEGKAGLYADPALAARADGLAARYDLAALRARSSRLHWAENLALLDMLERLLGERALPAADPAALLAVDVGAGQFQYATALQRFLRARAGGARVVLRGIEVDGHGIYRDGTARVGHARAHAALAGEGVRYEVADFLALRLPPQDVAVLLFPFVTLWPLLRWGLPAGLHRPRRLLSRVAATVRPGGTVLTVHQTAREAERMHALTTGLPLRCVRTVPLASELVPYAARTADRVGAVWLRE